MYRGLNHHGSLISQCSDDVQREHRLTGIQQSERRFHRDQNSCPSNPSAERVIQSAHWVYSRATCWQCLIRETDSVCLCVCVCVWVCVGVRYLQCTISGSSPLLRSLTELMNSRKSEGSSGTPWSGHATYCRCVTARSSPRWHTRTHETAGNQRVLRYHITYISNNKHVTFWK